MATPRPRLTALLLGGAMCVISVACVRAAAPAPTSASDALLLNRLTWGVNGQAVRALAQAGSVDRYLEQQLHPAPGDHLPPAIQAEVASMRLSRESVETLGHEFEAKRRVVTAITNPDQKKTAMAAHRLEQEDVGREAMQRQLLRDIYSPDQLREQTTFFWLNHFNVYRHTIDAFLGDYEDTIRPHALGKFRDLLTATVYHPAMLRYLNNAQNGAGKINENYARELMELHTLGVGSGYTQKDVQELARILTGVGVNLSGQQPHVRPARASQLVQKGLFQFNPDRHDYGDKVFLGHTIKGRGLAEVDEVIDILSRQPATAKFISRKLAVYYVSDNPPQALVDRMAATFQKTDGDIASVLRTMFDSPEFKASLGKKFKDPMHYTVSAVRVAYGDRPIADANPLVQWLTRLAEPVWGHQTPDGYPMTEASWSSSGGMATRFEFAQFIGQGSRPLLRAKGADGQLEPPPPGPLPDLSKDAGVQGLTQTLSPTTKAALAKAGSPANWNTLFLASPEFMRR